MHALVASGDAEVGAVVHDQRYLVAQRLADVAGMAQHLARVAGFVAILEQRHAPRSQVARIIHDSSGGAERRGETGDIEDGVEPGKVHVRNDFTTETQRHRE